jgi:hypothetical protein
LGHSCAAAASIVFLGTFLCSCCFNCFSWDILVQLLLQNSLENLSFQSTALVESNRRSSGDWLQFSLQNSSGDWCQVTFSVKKKRGKTWHDDLQGRSTLGRIWQSCLESETEIIW